MRGSIIASACAFMLTGCTAMNLGDRLGTMKNPNPTFDSPGSRTDVYSRYPFIGTNYGVLLQATTGEGPNRRFVDYATEKPVGMKRYLNAGFALSDFYCDEFFRDAEESQRRRKYGRAITNDVGTAMTTILGLANAGENLVTGAAAAFGFGDSIWRNYDEAFVVSPDLSNVRSLVLSAQDVFRKRSYAKLPTDYEGAQSTILRYANYCSTLGMKSLLEISSSQQQRELQREAGEAVARIENQGATGGQVQTDDLEDHAEAAPIAIPN